MSWIRLGWIGLGAVALFGVAAQEAPPPFKVLKPGPVIPNGPDAFNLTGMFSVSRDAMTTPSEQRSFGSGGACIYGDLAEVGAPRVACTTNAQCNQAWAGFHNANLGNPNYDAAAFGGAGANGQCIANRCWYRPSPAACTRKIPPDSWALGTHKFGPFSLRHVARLFGEDAKIKWQVVTCSNHAQADGTDDKACAVGQGMYAPPLEARRTDREPRIH